LGEAQNMSTGFDKQRTEPASLNVPPRAVGMRATSLALVGDLGVDLRIHVLGTEQPASERRPRW
jgi:hypothetical protein